MGAIPHSPIGIPHQIPPAATLPGNFLGNPLATIPSMTTRRAMQHTVL